jgi:predicted secreted hydrolase
MRVRELAVVCLLLALPGAQAQAASQLRLGTVLGQADDAGFARAEAPREFRFPADHGPHPRYRSEWWYLTASLETADGEAFGVQFTLFRQALRAAPVIGGPWDASQIYLAHLAVTDVGAGRHLEAERLGRGHPRLAGVSLSPFLAHLDGWTLAGSGPGLTGLRLQGDTGSFGVRLRLEPLKPIVLQGESGLSAKGPNQASYYYSLPRLAAAGNLRVGSKTVEVSGTAWLDREWSTSVLGDQQSGWDWFALQLESGEELMAFQLRNRHGVRDPYDQGVWVDADGNGHQLRTQDFTLEPVGFWKDDRGVGWPVAWRASIRSPDGPRQLEIRAAVDDQRMDTLLTYWEGLVWVLDETGSRIGTGYMELTGYE